MKKFIILIVILMIISLSGQEYPDSSQMAEVKEYLKAGNEYFYVMILGTWDLYTKECYADSTAVTFGYFYDYENYGREFKTVYRAKGGAYAANLIRTEQGYIHREPTLEGFIEFIRGMKGEMK